MQHAQQATQNERHVSTDTLVSDYLGIVNRALDRHGNGFLARNVLDLIERLIDQGERIGIAVYSTDASSPHDYYTVRFNDARRLELTDRGKDAPSFEWKLQRGYLEQVVGDPEPYVNNPLKLDWEWLKSRLS